MGATVKDIAGVRFLCLAGHLILLITLLIDVEPTVTASLPMDYSEEDRSSVQTELRVVLSVCIAGAAVEMAGLVSGISLLAPLTALSSCLCHGVAVLCLLFALMDTWPLSLQRLLLGVSSAPPALLEVATLLSFAVRGSV